MNRRLKIDIQSIEDEHEERQETSPFQEEESEEQEYSEEEEGEGEGSQEFEQDAQERSPDSQMSASKSKDNAYESIQTFGNHHHPHSKTDEFLEQLMRKPSNPRSRQDNFTIHHLNETPIGVQLTPNSYSNRRHELEQSNVDDEIARIISKVSRTTRKDGQLQEAEKIKKISRINNQLLKENTGLIGEINDLEKRLTELNAKMLRKRGSPKDDLDLTKKLKKYKEKLDKANNLNGKLSVRLTSERSRSLAISNTFRSMVNRQEVSSSEMMIVSSLSQQPKGDSEGQKSKKPSNFTQNNYSKVSQLHYCDKCCKKIDLPKDLASQDFTSKELMFSPVLQVKNYEIAGAKVTNQFELIRKPASRDVECQVNTQAVNSLEQLQALRLEEEMLQKTITANNKRIADCEELLYKLVEIS